MPLRLLFTSGFLIPYYLIIKFLNKFVFHFPNFLNSIHSFHRFLSNSSSSSSSSINSSRIHSTTTTTMSVYSYSVTPTPLGGIATHFDCFFLELNFNHYLHLSYPQETHVHFDQFRDSFFYPRDLFFSDEHGLRALLSIFSRTGGSDDFLEAIVSDVLSFAWELEGLRRSRNLDQKACALVVDVLVRTPYGDREEVDGILGELVQESRTGFTPAAESAIKSLKRVTASERRVKIGNVLGSPRFLPIKKRPLECSDSESGDCTVCLEDFAAADQLVELPCGHLYHNDCAVRWLQTSHLCPLCRYPLGVGQEG